MKTFCEYNKKKGYISPKGKSHKQITRMLKRIFKDHYEMDGAYENFDDMVDMMAGDDFFKGHLIAKAYKETEEWVNS